MKVDDSDSESFGDDDNHLNGASRNSLMLNYVGVSSEEYMSTDLKYQESKDVKCGDCYIFNYQKFGKKLPRPESKKDAERLKHDFCELNFDVHEFDNCSKLETMTILYEVSQKDHSQKKYFVCCFLTHGGLETLCMSDENIDVRDLLCYFTRLSCPTLSGKPKIFIIQACRGSKYETEVSANCADYFSIEGNEDYLDFLIVNSTYYDTMSFKSTNKECAIYHGSFFIDELCRSLEQFSDKLGLLQILTIVNYRVSYLFLSKSKNEEKNEKKQVPCFVSRLRSEVKFDKAITPFTSSETCYFDKRRKEFRLGIESTERPLSDIKSYQFQNPNKILFLSIVNHFRDIDQKLEITASNLWNSFAEKKYSLKKQEKRSKKLKRSEIMEFLNENLNSSEIDCLLCLFAGYSRNGRLLDKKERKISKEDVIKTCKSLTGKPKIFIYLLCELPFEDTVLVDGGMDCTSLRTNVIPFHADILEICITVTEWKQAVEPMETFCQFLNNSQEDFINVLTKINHELVEKHNFFMISESETYDPFNNCTFGITSTLTKSLFLP